MATSTETFRRSGRIDKRAAILDAALHTFLRDGYGLARIETIAEAAGVAKPTVYNHFRDKETLFRTVILDGTRRTADKMLTAVDALPDTGSDITHVLTRMAHSLIECQLSDEGWALQRLMYAEAPHFPDLFDQVLAQGGARAHSALAGRLARLANRGLLDTPDPGTAASHFLALVSGDLPSLSALGTRAVPPAKLRASIAAGIDTFLRAFGSSAKTGAHRRPGPSGSASGARRR